MSGYEVHIASTDFLGRTLRFVVAQRLYRGYEYVRPDGTHTIVDDTGQEPGEDFLWQIPVDALHPLLGALARHLGAVEHPEQLRSDYIAERNRVDKLLNHLIGAS